MPVIEKFSGDTPAGAASVADVFPPVLDGYAELELGPDDEDPIEDPLDPEPVSPIGRTFDDLSAGLFAREVGLY